MKIAVLNKCYLSDDHIAYLKSLGELEISTDTASEQQVQTRMAGKDIVLADIYEAPYAAAILQSPSLKLFCINSVGYDPLDAKAAARRGVKIANAAGFTTEAVAELVFALLLSLDRHIREADAAVRGKPFEVNSADKADSGYRGFNLYGKTMGIVGLGRIGGHAAKIAQGFGMKVLAYNRSPKSVGGVEMVDMDSLFARADVIALCVPLNDGTKHIINAASIGKMKTGAVIINIARGGCVNSADLAQALASGKIAGAGLDVLDDWTLNNPLFKAPNTVITPHSGFFTTEALAKMGEIMTANVKAFVAGKPINIVN